MPTLNRPFLMLETREAMPMHDGTHVSGVSIVTSPSDPLAVACVPRRTVDFGQAHSWGDNDLLPGRYGRGLMQRFVAAAAKVADVLSFGSLRTGLLATG